MVISYLILNFIVIATGMYEIATHPTLLGNWKDALFTTTTVSGATEPRSIFLIIGLSLLVFPKLALGLSGFETGVAVMPLIKESKSDWKYTENF